MEQEGNNEHEIEIKQIWSELESEVLPRTLRSWISKGVLPKHQREDSDPDGRGRKFWYPAITVPQARRAKELFDSKLDEIDVRLRLLVEGYQVDFRRFKLDQEKELRVMLKRVNRSEDPRKTIRTLARDVADGRSRNGPERTIRKRLGRIGETFDLSVWMLEAMFLGNQETDKRTKAQRIIRSAFFAVLVKAFNLKKPWPNDMEHMREGFVQTLREVIEDFSDREPLARTMLRDMECATESDYREAYYAFQRFLKIRPLEGVFRKVFGSTPLGLDRILSDAEKPWITRWITMLFVWHRCRGQAASIEQIVGTIDEQTTKVQVALDGLKNQPELLASLGGNELK